MILRIIFDRWELVGGASGITLPYNSLSVEFSKFPHYYGFLALAIITIYMNWKINYFKTSNPLEIFIFPVWRALLNSLIRSKTSIPICL